MAADAFARFALRRVMRLPPALLRLMSGGGVAYQGGRTLDAGFQFLAARSRNAPSLASMSPQDARRAVAQALAMALPDAPGGVVAEEGVCRGEGGEIPVRVYRPERTDPTAPVMVFAHGGGGVLGDLDMAHPFCALLAARARCPVVSVGYRLAPEHRFPAGLADVLAAFRWARANAATFGAREGAAAIGGDSMGATLATAACRLLREAGETQPQLQLLFYPLVDMAGETPSMTTYAEAFGLSRASMDWCLGQYVGPGDDPADPRLSPLRAHDLSRLAPAIVVAAGFDPLVDQGLAYVKALRAAGVPTIWRGHDSLAHGFVAYAGLIPAAMAAAEEACALVRAAFDS